MNDFDCDAALALIAAYTDGELSEAQAGPLRKHLLSCPACRNSAQALKASSRWFQRPEVADLVPAGFAARVARRAFAGDTGERGGGAVALPAVSAAVVDPRRQLGFLLEITGIAAAVLVAFSVAFRMREVPSGEPLRAEETLSVQEIKDRLAELNAAAEARSERTTVPDATPDATPDAAEDR